MSSSWLISPKLIPDSVQRAISPFSSLMLSSGWVGSAIMQKFIDQSISANTNYDPTKFEDSRVPMKVMIQDLLMAYKLGVKTLYYHNTRDGANDAQDDLENGCAGGACTL